MALSHYFLHWCCSCNCGLSETLIPRYPGGPDFTIFSGTTEYPGQQVKFWEIWSSEEFIRSSEVSGLSRSGITGCECNLLARAPDDASGHARPIESIVPPLSTFEKDDWGAFEPHLQHSAVVSYQATHLRDFTRAQIKDSEDVRSKMHSCNIS